MPSTFQLGLGFDGDPCAARHRNNPASADAYEAVKGHKLDTYAAILAILHRAPHTGKEIAMRLERPFNAISGRLSEMKSEPLLMIEETGERRGGCAVLRAKGKA